MAGETPEQRPLVTEEHLDLSLVAPPNRRLTIPVGITDEEGTIVRRENREFKVRGRVDVDRMVSLMQLETRINEALHPDATSDSLIEALDEANSEIRSMLSELNDDVPAALRLDEQQTLIVLAWFASDVSVADAIAHALTGGATGARTAEELTAAAADGGAGDDVADAAAPFPSR